MGKYNELPESLTKRADEASIPKDELTEEQSEESKMYLKGLRLHLTTAAYAILRKTRSLI